MPPPSVEPPSDPGTADVLDDWDVGVDAGATSRRTDRGPFPVDTVAVLAGAVAGAVLSAGTRRASPVGALVSGGVCGAAIAAGARRVWRLEP